jgi:succinoglycan biosynthesis protein ExoA
MTNANPRVSIVIACRNEGSHIAALLESIDRQESEGVTWEAIFADGLSDDGTREALDARCAKDARFRVIGNPGRIASTGLNAAIRQAKGEIVLRMDAHTRYRSDYVDSCVKTLRLSGADNVGGPARTEPRAFRARVIAAAYHSRFSTGGARFHDVEFEGWVDTVPYGCWRKSTLEKIGLFDEQLVRSQDDELNLRIVRTGGKIWQSPRIVSWYSPRSSLSSLFWQYLQYGYWKVAVIRKHRIPGSWRHLVPVAFVAAHLILPAGMAAAAMLGAPDWFRFFALTWLALLVLYGGANLMASVNASRTHGWSTIVLLPAVFAVYHLAYGLGFLAGLLRRPPENPGRADESVFARITR